MAGQDVIYEPPTGPEWAALATNPMLVAALATTAQRGKMIAEILAADFAQSTNYARSFDVRMDVATFDRIEPRAVALLVNTAPYAAAVEDRHHVLARTRDLLQAT